MEKHITIFTDGASKGNPGPGGWGAVILVKEKVQELGSRVEHTTNNRMELTAALMALRFLSSGYRGYKATIYTDSNYLINGITKWINEWQKRGWVTKKKEDVLNVDLWKELVHVLESSGVSTEWNYVGGHVGIPGNERVDEIASNFAEGKEVALYAGSSDEYEIDLSHVNFDKAKKTKKSSSKSRSRAAAYSYISELNGEIQVHDTWPECEARVKGKPARFKKALSAEEEKQIIKEFSS